MGMEVKIFGTIMNQACQGTFLQIFLFVALNRTALASKIDLFGRINKNSIKFFQGPKYKRNKMFECTGPRYVHAYEVSSQSA